MSLPLRIGCVLALGLASPELLAHSAASGDTGWLAGFGHPLQGWDHLVAMLALGVWAARRTGRRVWELPLAFVVAMTCGAAGAWLGLPLRGVEIVIVASVPVLAVLAAGVVRPSMLASITLAAGIGLCHGYAHGAEIPAGAGVLSFGVGFLIATALLHGVGIAVARLLVLALSGSAWAVQAASPQAAADSAGQAGARLQEVLVLGRADALTGLATSASQGTVGARDLAARPLLRAGEVLEAVPGVIATQHAGGGKANQYFLRGFNLDHGTDFATSLDGMPLNLRSHGHGQGYTDVNIVIPELVRRVNYDKGVYYAANGDFSSAGAAAIETVDVLPQGIAAVEGGLYGYGRTLLAASPRVGDGHLLGAVELLHHDGPWDNADDYQRVNAIVRYSGGTPDAGYALTARAHDGRWDSSDQVAASAVEIGLVSPYGSLDASTGGDTSRYSLQAQWQRADAATTTRVAAWGMYSDLALYSNFTYFLVDPVRGDQFEQVDQRHGAGLDARHSWLAGPGIRDAALTLGLQLRGDWIDNGLYNTRARRRVDKIDAATGATLPATVRADDITETSAAVYAEGTIQWTSRLRTVAGLRADLYDFDVESLRAANSGGRVAGIVSPKLTAIHALGPAAEAYVQAGYGFHSNDARGVLTRVDPVTGAALDADGNPIVPADPLVRTRGAEGGLRSTALPGLQSTLAVWWLDVESELLFVGDAGATEASRPSRRYGVEWANHWTATPSLTLDADVSWSHAAFRDRAPEGDHVPGAIETVVAGGIAWQPPGPWSASLRLRYFGPRPLVEDDSLRSDATILLGGRLAWRPDDTWTIAAEVFNLLDRDDHDIDYAYESRTTPGGAVATGLHYHPVEPVQVRIGATARF